MQLKTIKISKLKPHPKNCNKHPKEQLSELRNSLERFNQIKNIVVWKNKVIAGCGLLEAARLQNKKDIIVQDVSDWPEEKAISFMIADNRLAEIAVMDDDLLANLLKEFDNPLDIPGINEEFLDSLNIGFGGVGEGLTDDDVVPDAPEDPVAKLGDLWILGEHRLLCGDAMDTEHVSRLMDGQKADMVLTDPPYGIKRADGFDGFDGFGGLGKPIKRKKYKGGWDNNRPGKDCFEIILNISKKVMIFGGNYFADLLPQGKHWIVWDKKNTMPTFGDCELIWTNIQRDSVKIKEFEYNGLIGKEKERFHATQKPVLLLVDLIEEYEKECGIVFDGFGGSGSTLIACQKTNRKCYMMEIDPHYIDVCIQRWADFTGKDPVREDGVKFSELKKIKG